MSLSAQLSLHNITHGKSVRTNRLDRCNQEIITQNLCNLGKRARLARKELLHATNEEVRHGRRDEETIGGHLECSGIDFGFSERLGVCWVRLGVTDGHPSEVGTDDLLEELEYSCFFC